MSGRIFILDVGWITVSSFNVVDFLVDEDQLWSTDLISYSTKGGYS
jgi:hypothetical protein